MENYDPILTFIDEVDSKYEEESKSISLNCTKNSSLFMQNSVEVNK